ncbi:hypothetical protein H2199_001139 [Coniosporium tulheliwenetii]|uniref:Uncharacterized protein n=1 Tax=Coniosporium tulheliwenetii TaxID=3383036 RepID=A0ACC2ZLP5_9PEZI|nr:hypothetical protein H2199_001139 [Cladosporium sp. JES 115]
MTDLSIYDHDKTLYLFTSLTAGSSHIITATSRIETILKANKIPFQGGGGRKLPLLVKEGYVIGDLAEVEEWNEFGELKEAIGDVEAPKGSASSSTAAPAAAKSSSSAASTTTKTPASTPAAPAQPPQNKENAPPTQQTLAMRQLSTEAAAVGASKQTPKGSSPASAAGEPNPTSRRRSSIPAPPEEIKAVEQALAIPEEEEDDSEEGDDEDEDDEDDEDENDDEDEDEDEEEKVGAQRADAAAPPAAAGTGSGNGEGVKKGGDAAAAEKAGRAFLIEGRVLG